MKGPDQLIRVTDQRQQFSHVPFPLIQAMRDGLVPPAAVALYAALDQYRDRQTGRAWPGLRTLARDIGLSRGWVHEMIVLLERTGFVGVERPRNPSHPVVYALRYAPGPRIATGGGARPVYRTRDRTRPARVRSTWASGDLTPLHDDGHLVSPIVNPDPDPEFQRNHRTHAREQGGDKAGLAPKIDPATGYPAGVQPGTRLAHLWDRLRPEST